MYDLFDQLAIFEDKVFQVDDVRKNSNFIRKRSDKISFAYTWEKYSEKEMIQFVSQYTDILSSIYGKNIILTKIYPKDKYYDIDGNIQQMNKNNELCEKALPLVRMCENYFSSLTSCYIIDIAEKYISDDNFPFNGASPFHYEKEYYTEFCSELLNIIKDDRNADKD